MEDRELMKSGEKTPTKGSFSHTGGSNNSASSSVAPCHSAGEVAVLQKQALIDGINECKSNEEKRVKALMQAHSSDKVKELTRRQNKERANERAYIRMLTEELRMVERMAETNMLDITSRPRVMVRPPPEMDADRFAAPIFIDAVEKFERMDKRFNNKQRQKNNEYEERKKLILMEQKRDVLKSIVNIQTEAVKSAMSSGALASSSYSPPVRASRPSYDARSVSSRASSDASYASFDSRREAPKQPRPLARTHQAFEERVRTMVPRLSIGQQGGQQYS